MIAAGEDRDAAMSRLVQALRTFPILGVTTNVPFLIRILEHPEFRNGAIDTRWIDAELPVLTAEEPAPQWLSTLAFPQHLRDRVEHPRDRREHIHDRHEDPWTMLKNWRS